MQVGQLVHAMKMGWVKISQAKKDEEENDDEKLPNFYELWTCDSQVNESSILMTFSDKF